MSTGGGPELVVATGNPGKLAEFRALFEGVALRLRSLAEFERFEFPEEGDDYEANAIVKARTAAVQTGRLALADDSGLEVDALDGRPGVRSARYGGPGLDDAGRVKRLLGELEGTPPSARTARFVCVAALAAPDGRVETARGLCEGRILTKPSGERGFGYDPVFQADGESVSMAELEAAVKNRISHRARACQAIRPALEAQLGLGGS